MSIFRILSLLTLLAGFCQGLFAQSASSLPKDTLIFNWSVEQVGLPQGMAQDFGLSFELKRNHTFAAQVYKKHTDPNQSRPDSLIHSGRWQWEPGNQLVLTHERLPIRTDIDSLSYEVIEGKPSLRFFEGGKLVLSQDLEGLESERRISTFEVQIRDDSGLILQNEAGERVQLGGRVILQPPGFAFMDVVRGFLGILFVLLFCWLLSTNRKAINWRLVASGILLQLFFAVLVLTVPGVKEGFQLVARVFVTILGFTEAGTRFIFGGLGFNNPPFGVLFAFQILPIIIFFSAITSLLYYLGLLQRVVYGFAWVMNKTMQLSGAESLAAAGNIFLGQTEAPLLVKPYLEGMTRSEILCLMGGGMATIAGSVFGAYVGFLGGDDPVQKQLFATHLLTASIIAAPGAIVAAKMLLPETEKIEKNLQVPKEKIGSNALDAITNGATEGTRLAVNVGVMLLVFIAFVEGFNVFLGDLIGEIGSINEAVANSTDGKFSKLSLQYLFGIVFAPIAWLLGAPTQDMMVVGQLLGEKTIINEFVAYGSLAEVKEVGKLSSYKSLIIATYALCGFANISSIGIQIGGIGALAPGQRKTLSSLGVRALIVGTMAAFLSASIAGMLSGI